MTTGNSQATGGAMVGGITSTEILQLRAEVARLIAERDAWLDKFNRSEQFQDGPTKRAEAAEARLAALTAALEGLEQEMRDYDGSMHRVNGWADRLAALRTP